MNVLKKNNKLKILLIGTLPPPYGGITVHIERLYNIYLKSEINCTVLNINNKISSITKKNKNVITLKGVQIKILLKMINILYRFNGDIIHFHVSAMNKFSYIGIILIKISSHIPKIITLHSGSFIDNYKKSNNIKKFFVRKILYNCSHIIVVNTEQFDFLTKKIGIGKNKISLIPAFLPPLYPDNVIEKSIENKFLELKKNVDKIAIVAGFIMPLYGFHYVLDVFKKLKKQGIKLGLVFIFYTKENKNYKKFLFNYIQKLPDILIFKNLSPANFSQILKLTDIFIRPSTYDGDSVALREAIYFKKQIIASDCTKRPKGTVIFKNKNEDDFEKKLLKIINNKNMGIATNESVNNSKKIINIYYRLSKSYK